MLVLEADTRDRFRLKKKAIHTKGTRVLIYRRHPPAQPSGLDTILHN